MSADTSNIDLGVLFPSERERKSAVGRPRDPERLRLLREEELVASFEEPANPRHGRTFATYRPLSSFLEEETCEATAPEPVAEVEKEPIAEHEPGVDLSILHPEETDTAGLIAGIQAVTAGQTKMSDKVVAMPMARTDLQEIFHEDRVCVVSRPFRAVSEPTPPATPEPTFKESTPSTTVQAAVPPSPVSPSTDDRTLQYLSENWSKLPQNVQAAILNVIHVAVGPDDE